MDAIGVELQGIEKSFGTGEAKVSALKGIDFTAKKGELTMIVGPSGCGKTTLLSVIAATLTPDVGTAHVFGQNLTAMSQEELAAFRSKEVGFIFQQYHLIPTLTVLENVIIPLLIQGKSIRESEEKGMLLLEKVGLKGKGRAFPKELSGGQQQRVAIARALVHDPRLVVCDEPTSALDKETGEKIMNIIKESAISSERCFLLVTHDSRIFHYADAVVEMDDGFIKERRRNHV